MSEQHGLLPEGWAVTSIKDLLAPLEDGRLLHHGWSPQCEIDPSPRDEVWGVLKTTAIQDGGYVPMHNKRLPSGLEPRPQLEAKEGDILITCAGPRRRCGVACLVRTTRPRLMISGKMYRFRALAHLVNPTYLEAQLRSHSSQSAIDRMKTGISDSGLNLTHDRFLALPVLVAPLSEQNRMVAKIEELFSDLDAGIAALKRVEANLARHKESVLKAAVEGELTKQWREEHPTAESASVLLERILEERRMKWEQRELAKYESKGQKPPARWKEKYKEPVGPETRGLPVLPHGWCWTSVDQLSDAARGVTYGVVKLGEPVQGGIPTLRSSNVRSLTLDLEYVKPISRSIAGAYQRTRLEGGEILVTIRGTLGGVAVAPTAIAGFNVSREVAVIPLVEPAIGSALAFFIASDMVQNWILTNTRGIAYVGINLETLRLLPLPLAPIDELREIADRVEVALSATAAVNQDVALAMARSVALRASILSRAFSGRLVPQDPTDEPTPVLLDRIRAERVASAASKLARKPRRSKKTSRTDESFTFIPIPFDITDLE